MADKKIPPAKSGGKSKGGGSGGSGGGKSGPKACPNWVQGRPCNCAACTAGGAR
jgi:hypothetical protein